MLRIYLPPPPPSVTTGAKIVPIVIEGGGRWQIIMQHTLVIIGMVYRKHVEDKNNHFS